MEIALVPPTSAEKVFINVQNNEGDELLPGEVVEWDQTTTDADQGFGVQVVVAAINATTGIGAQVAGVVDSTITTGETGRLQVYGPDLVRASASLDVSRMVVAGSINATNKGHVTTSIQTTTTAAQYHGAIVGWTLENGPNATNSTVQLTIL
jgi:hypothetical protein